MSHLVAVGDKLLNTGSSASKLPNVGTTIFTVMSKMAQDHQAINLSQGFPDFPVPGPLIDLLHKYTLAGYNQYPPMAGVPYLLEQIASKTRRIYDCSLSTETEITVTSGATEALFVAIQAMIHPGDEAIVLDPAYDSYDPAIRLAGGSPVHVPLEEPGFTVDWQRVRQAITSRTRVIVVNTPHNPCGSVFSAEDVKELSSLAEHHQLTVISDEVYEHMVFDGQRHQSLLLDESLRSRSFVISSFGKTCHATGWKIAYCVAPESLTREFRKVHQFVTFTTHTPSQWALAEFLENHPEHYLALPRFYEAKRDIFIEAMANSGFSMKPSAGTYFQLADYSELSDMPDTEFAQWLTKEVGVAAIPVSVFCEAPHCSRLVRFCFAKDDQTLRDAAEKLGRAGDML